MHRRFLSLSFAIASAIALTPSARAQCNEWDTGFAPHGMTGQVNAFAVFDDGSGPALYAGGNFVGTEAIVSNRIARWHDGSWSALGTGLNGTVSALLAFDDGSGPALFVGGSFTIAGGISALGIARWNGSAWSPVAGGTNGSVNAFTVFDDGTGPALYVAGTFTSAGGVAARDIARWNGTSWSALGSGVSSTVNVLAVFDDGAGPRLFAGGFFNNAGAVGASNIAKWDGSNWSALGAGVSSAVNSLAVFDDGSGLALYIGGNFASAGGMFVGNVTRWNGVNFADLGGGILAQPFALSVFDDGTGAALYAGLNTLNAALPCSLAKWNGANWLAVGPPLPDGTSVRALQTFDDGSGNALAVGGSFASIGGVVASNIAQWNGSSWHALAQGGGGLEGLNPSVYAFAVDDHGALPVTYVAGTFMTAGDSVASNVASHTLHGWSPLGLGIPNTVYAAIDFDDGSGPALIVGGDFTQAGGVPASRIARWNGAGWSPLGTGISNIVYSLGVFDAGSGPMLYAGGATGVQRWNGSSWTAIGSASAVKSFAVYDDGTGSKLYAGGDFTSIAGVPANHIARWNGTNWSAVGSGIDNAFASVFALAVHDDGSGPKLYVGGAFSSVGGVAMSNIARWDGALWSVVGAGFVQSVNALLVHDDGNAASLYAGGAFTALFTNPPTSMKRLARWDGASWSEVGGGTDFDVYALAEIDDGHDGDADLYVGGRFTSAGGVPSKAIARFEGCGTVPFCFGDGSGSACPCANNGVAGKGCDNSAATGGAKLAATGTVHPDKLVLTSSGELASALSIFLQGNVEVSATPFGDGLRCVGGSLKRLYTKNASAGTVSAPNFGAGDPSITTRSANLGDPIAPGSTRSYQTYYRDPNLTFCPPPSGDSWNISNGVRVLWKL